MHTPPYDLSRSVFSLLLFYPSTLPSSRSVNKYTIPPSQCVPYPNANDNLISSPTISLSHSFVVAESTTSCVMTSPMSSIQLKHLLQPLALSPISPDHTPSIPPISHLTYPNTSEPYRSTAHPINSPSPVSFYGFLYPLCGLRACMSFISPLCAMSMTLCRIEPELDSAERSRPPAGASLLPSLQLCSLRKGYRLEPYMHGILLSGIHFSEYPCLFLCVTSDPNGHVLACFGYRSWC